MSYADLWERVKEILLQPGETWPEVRDEQARARQIYQSYVVLLAAIPAVSRLIGMAFVGVVFLGIRYRTSFLSALEFAVCSYILSLAFPYVYGLIINALAPLFRSERSSSGAFRLAVYSSTPAWIAGVLLIVPALAPVAFLLSLYGFYLLYLGLSPLMNTPGPKRAAYFIVLSIVGLLISIGLSLLVGLVLQTGPVGVL
jgi:hypothetical protein